MAIAYVYSNSYTAPMDPKLASRIIDELGGPSAVARLCQCRQPSVTQWRHRGIPLSRHLYLHAIRPDVVPAPTPETPAGVGQGVGDAA